MFVYSLLQSGLVLAVTLKGMNNTDQTKVTTVHSVLAERASPKCQELTLFPILFSFALHICNFMEASSGEIKGRGRGVRGDEEAEVKEQTGS